MNKWVYVVLALIVTSSAFTFLLRNDVTNIFKEDISKEHIKGSWHIATVNGEMMDQTRLILIINEKRIGMAYYNYEGECRIKNMPIESIKKDYVETERSREGLVSIKAVDHGVAAGGDKEVTFMINSMVDGMPAGISSGNKIKMYESIVISAKCRNGNLVTKNRVTENMKELMDE